MSEMPRRRFTDHLRELADRLWDRGDKEGATEMHDLARRKEIEREEEFLKRREKQES